MWLRACLGTAALLLGFGVLFAHQAISSVSGAVYEFETVQLVLPGEDGLELSETVSSSPSLIPSQVSGTLQGVRLETRDDGTAAITGQVTFETVARVMGRDGSHRLQLKSGGAKFSSVLSEDNSRVACSLTELEGHDLVHSPTLVRMIERFSFAVFHTNGHDVVGFSATREAGVAGKSRYTAAGSANSGPRSDGVQWLADEATGEVAAYFMSRTGEVRAGDVSYVQSTISMIKRRR